MNSVESLFVARQGKSSRPILGLRRAELSRWLKAQRASTKSWVSQVGFKAKPGELLLLPSRDGALERVLLGLSEEHDLFDWAGLHGKLPAGRYHIENELEASQSDGAALGFALGSYRFDRYKPKGSSKRSSLAWPRAADPARVTRLFEATCLARDLINTPAGDMGPTALAEAARALAKQHGARAQVVVGDQLLKQNYPAIHAVGRAASDAPRLIDLTWGDATHPKLTLVGKGVCFDTGGLDIKPADSMRLMKKDMGGAALMLGLAHVVMSAGLPVRLRLLIPAVENSVAGNAYRPMDVLNTRKGLTVEVGHTDAEGRLVLADALTEADSEAPDLLLDAATLTGAARVALGAELPALFTPDDALAEELLSAGLRAQDPLWRLPLFEAYRDQIRTPVADLNNQGGPLGGAITAALFLQSFVSKGRRWAHIDTNAWNVRSRPGRPMGGEAFALRALTSLLTKRYGT